MAPSSFITVFVVCVVVCCVQACKPAFKDCDSVRGQLITVNYNGTCDSSTKSVILRKKSYAGITIVFKSNEDTASLKAVVHGQIEGVFVPFPLDNPDACKNSNVTCPVQSGRTYTYNSVIYVRPVYPTLKLVVKWELQDAQGKDVVCVVIPAQITD